MKAVHVVISGIVQGVGFRAFVYQQAHKYQLTGWVRNTGGNKVEAVFCGNEQAITSILNDCKIGSYASEVHEVIVKEDIPTQQFTSFDIL